MTGNGGTTTIRCHYCQGQVTTDLTHMDGTPLCEKPKGIQRYFWDDAAGALFADNRSGFVLFTDHEEAIARAFADGYAVGNAEGAAAEREACAQAVEAHGPSIVVGRPSQRYIMLSLAVAAIRARGES